MLLEEIQRVLPFYHVRQLARFQDMQDRMGGGFGGCIADQLVLADEIPLPVDANGAVETAMYLARQREANLNTLEKLGIPTSFIPLEAPDAGAGPRDGWGDVAIDLSVPTAFIEALADGQVTMGEAREIVGLQPNRELLQVICAKCEGTEAKVSEQTLAYLVWKAGSAEPLDRLWRWVNPMNNFGYADLATHAEEYALAIEELKRHEDQAVAAAMGRIVPYLVPDRPIDGIVAFAPSCLVGDWVSPGMSAANLPHLREGWDGTIRSTAAGLLRKHLLRRWSEGGRQAAYWPAKVGDVVTGDDPLRDLYSLVAYAVLEGVVDHACGDPPPDVESATAMDGARLLADFASQSTDGQQPLPLFENAGRVSLSRLGQQLVRSVEENEGRAALAELLDRGPVAVAIRAAELEAASRTALLDDELIVTLKDLQMRLEG